MAPREPEIQPDVSVVVPTRLRETRLAFLLEALSAQTLEPGRFEVVVVRAPDALSVPLVDAPEGFCVRFLVADRVGAAAQRNTGWRAALAPLVAFTDDDCRPRPDWLEALLGEPRSEATIVQGRTESDPQERHLLGGFARSLEAKELDPWSPTCNIAYPRSLLERLGGFDESFPAAWGEDTDLALRARKQGAQQIYCDEAVVWHAVHPRSFMAAAREALSRSNIPIVLKRHPGHRRNLYLALFVKPTHASLLAGSVIAFALRRRGPLALIAFAPYVNAYLDFTAIPLRSLPRFLVVFMPRRAAMEAIEIAGLATASIRYRSPVL